MPARLATYASRALLFADSTFFPNVAGDLAARIQQTHQSLHQAMRRRRTGKGFTCNLVMASLPQTSGL